MKDIKIAFYYNKIFEQLKKINLPACIGLAASILYATELNSFILLKMFLIITFIEKMIGTIINDFKALTKTYELTKSDRIGHGNSSNPNNIPTLLSHS